jgi:hypothetical protein
VEVTILFGGAAALLAVPILPRTPAVTRPSRAGFAPPIAHEYPHTTMHRFFAGIALCLPLAIAACPQRDAPESPPAAPDTPAMEPADPVLAQTERCTDPDAGFRIEYPAGWRTNPGEVMPACSLFDPEPIRIEPATELPFDIAVTIRRENVAFATVTAEQPHRRELLREELPVDGRRAVRMETELTEDMLRPAGSRSYRYYVEMDGTTLIAETHDAGDLDYGRKQRILDGMVQTLRFTGAP